MARLTPPIIPSLPAEAKVDDLTRRWTEDLISTVGRYLDEVTTSLEERVPGGGTTGQTLSKVNDEDYNTEWS